MGEGVVFNRNYFFTDCLSTLSLTPPKGSGSPKIRFLGKHEEGPGENMWNILRAMSEGT